MEIAVKMVEMSSEGRGWRLRCGGGGGAGDSLPSWLHGSPPPWRWDPWGRQKRGSGVYKFVGGGVSHELGFLPLYSFLDFRLPILGRTRSGLTWLSGLGIRRILCLEHLL
jgi:hypothetical protein